MTTVLNLLISKEEDQTRRMFPIASSWLYGRIVHVVHAKFSIVAKYSWNQLTVRDGSNSRPSILTEGGFVEVLLAGAGARYVVDSMNFASTS